MTRDCGVSCLVLADHDVGAMPASSAAFTFRWPTRSRRGLRKSVAAFQQEFGKANLTSLVERRSRFTILTRNPSRHSAGVMAGIDRQLKAVPPSLRQSITFDRGTEFAAFLTLREKLGMTSYFCMPSAPWQKGSVENSNGRIRRFLPLDTDTIRP